MLGALIITLLALVFLAFYALHRERTYRRRVARSESRLSTILDTTGELIHIKDREGRYQYANPKTCEFFGLPASALVMRHNRELLTEDNIIAAVERDEQQVLESGQRVTTQKRISSLATGKIRTYQIVKVPLRDTKDRIESICTIMTDVTDRIEAEARAHKLTFYDALTDLPNARFLIRRLTQVVQLARDEGENGALLILDLDDFKKVNDSQGFDRGDQVLRDVAQRLISGTRARDTVSRINGDVFAVLLTQLGNHADESAGQATELARTVMAALSDAPLAIGQSPFTLKVSAGMTMLNAGTGSAHAAMREADIAMHQAKAQGGNRMTFYEQALQHDLEQRLWLEQDLVRALGTPQLRVYAQPQHSCDGKVVGAELLARWHHPTHGMIPPDVFIPLADKMGLLGQITDWGMARACEALKTLSARGLNYLISVNISPRCLLEHDFPGRVRHVLEASGAPSQMLILEVTEGTWLGDYGAAAKCMAEIRELGVRFSVDDFGTGYSNLACLKRLPLFELKIDKSLVQDLPYDQDAAAIVQMALTMARQLGLRTVAEGVETPAQSDFLRSQHCDALQGYLLGRPMPIEDWLGQFD